MKKILNILLTLLIATIFSVTNIDKINAASAKISVSSSTSQIVLGKEFTVTVKISSSSALGSWEWVIDYDTKRFKLVSGTSYIVDYASSGSKKSASYTYKFKTIGTGKGKIGVKSYGGYAWDESKLSISTSSKTVNVITQAQLEASYSKNNDLKSLSIDGLTLSPSFNKDTLEYTAEAGANTTKIKINASKADSKASVSGAGEKEVSEGDNKFEITVTAQNGSSKTYTVIVKVTDPNPINVLSEDGENLTVIKRESLMQAPENYESTKVTISEQEVPGFYSEINNITLVGLKNEAGDVSLHIYDKENNTFTKYNEISLDKVTIFPLSIDKSVNEKYKKDIVTIMDEEFEALVMTNPQFAIIHAKDLSTGQDNYYIYDTKLNTLITYDDAEEKLHEKEIEKYFNIIVLLCAESLIVFIILIGMLISKARKNKKRKRKLEELKKEQNNKDKQNGSKKDEINESKEKQKDKEIEESKTKDKEETLDANKEDKKDKKEQTAKGELKEETTEFIEEKQENIHKKKKKKKKQL